MNMPGQIPGPFQFQHRGTVLTGLEQACDKLWRNAHADVSAVLLHPIMLGAITSDPDFGAWHARTRLVLVQAPPDRPALINKTTSGMIVLYTCPVVAPTALVLCSLTSGTPFPHRFDLLLVELPPAPPGTEDVTAPPGARGLQQ